MPLNARAMEEPTQIEDGLTRGDAQPAPLRPARRKAFVSASEACS
jgi:hypothetical protein